ncbi:MAG TPA: segregation/condensation protein A [Longimicrobiales bacterium]|nr:segregation/condensation protein A [Longimicrobiales bacterium]
MSIATATIDPTGQEFTVELDRFSGPLELLLHLIREQDIDIFDIPIAQVTQQFLNAIEGVEHLGIDRAGEFLEMAATLIRIKSQMLLPRRQDEEGELEDPRAELVRRLLEYEHFREVARRLEDAEGDRTRHFARGYVPPLPKRASAEAPLEVTWEQVQAAIEQMAERTRVPDPHRVEHRAIPLEEKLELIVQTLERVARVEFRTLLAPYSDRRHGVVTFLAGLELARQKALLLRQRDLFAPLWFLRRDADALRNAYVPTDDDTSPETSDNADDANR